MAGPGSELLSITEVQRLLGGVSRATIYRMIKRGELPEPIKVGRLSRWRRSDVDLALAKLSTGCTDTSAATRARQRQRTSASGQPTPMRRLRLMFGGPRVLPTDHPPSSAFYWRFKLLSVGS